MRAPPGSGLPRIVRNMDCLVVFLATSHDFFNRCPGSAGDAIFDWQWVGDCCYDHSVLHAPLAQLAEQRTLNPRVRGSSPWRRTRTDLGFCRSRSFFMCPFCPRGGSVFARKSGPGRHGLVKKRPRSGRAGCRRPPCPLDQWSISLARAHPLGSWCRYAA